MNSETATMTTDDATEPSDGFVEYAPHELDADRLYELREDAIMVGAVDLAARVEIERGNLLTYEGYLPSFTHGELVGLGQVLMRAKEAYSQRGDDSAVERCEATAEIFMAEIDLDVPTEDAVIDGE